MTIGLRSKEKGSYFGDERIQRLRFRWRYRHKKDLWFICVTWWLLENPNARRAWSSRLWKRSTWQFLKLLWSSVCGLDTQVSGNIVVVSHYRELAIVPSISIPPAIFYAIELRMVYWKSFLSVQKTITPTNLPRIWISKRSLKTAMRLDLKMAIRLSRLGWEIGRVLKWTVCISPFDLSTYLRYTQYEPTYQRAMVKYWRNIWKKLLWRRKKIHVIITSKDIFMKR